MKRSFAPVLIAILFLCAQGCGGTEQAVEVSKSPQMLASVSPTWGPWSEVRSFTTAPATVTEPPPPELCTYTYSGWSECQSDGTQTRIFLSSSPSGCVGTPVLTQSCVYTPPPTVIHGKGWGKGGRPK